MVKNILLLTYWSYKDGLVQSTLVHVRLLRKTLPQSSWIYLFTLEQPKFRMTAEEVLSAEKELAKDQIKLIRFPYSPFGIAAMLKMAGLVASLAKICFTKNISHIQAWCTPAGAIGYLLSLLTGKPLILESYEPHAEAMLESGTWQKDGLAFKTLFALEKKQAEHAEIVISCVEGMRDYAKEKFGIRLKNHLWKPSPVDLEKFRAVKPKDPALMKELGLEGKVVGIYMGKFGGSYMCREVFDFFKACETHWGDRFRVILLNNHSDEEIELWAGQSGLDTNKIIKRFLPHSEVPKYVGLADFGLTPFIPVPSKRYGSPLKNAEYWSVGLPVVIPPNISDDSEIIEQHDIGTIMRDLSPEGYKKNILDLERLLAPEALAETKARVHEVADRYRSTQIAFEVYQKEMQILTKS